LTVVDDWLDPPLLLTRVFMQEIQLVKKFGHTFFFFFFIRAHF
jgi:hypothetical protein